MSSSTESGDPGSAAETIQVGYVRRAHGIKGAVIVRPLTDDPERLVTGSEFVTDSTDFPTLTIASIQPHKDGSLVGFAGITERTVAETLRGVSLLIAESDRRQLGQDEYWPDELVGLKAVDLAGSDLGTVTDLVAGVAQDRLRVDGHQGIFEIPFVAALVPEVDIAAGRVVIDPPEGLIEG